MNPLLAAVLLIQPQVPAIPPATLDDALEVGGEDVAARSVRTRLSVPVRIDGQGPFRFIVDSGADRSVIGAGVAARLGLPRADDVTLHGISGTSRVSTVSVASLQVGGSVIERLTLPALLEADLGAQGLLGIDALADQRLLLDFERKTIAVEDSRRAPAAASDEIVVVARRRRGQLILTQVEVRGIPIFAVIDTGSEITVGNLALAARLFRGRRAKPQPMTLTDVTGRTVEANLAIVPEIKIARLILGGVAVAFADLPPFKLFGLADQPALLLGNDVLEAFRRVSLDFGRRRVRFQLR